MEHALRTGGSSHGVPDCLGRHSSVPSSGTGRTYYAQDDAQVLEAGGFGDAIWHYVRSNDLLAPFALRAVVKIS